jgi:hypothetical protein
MANSTQNDDKNKNHTGQGQQAGQGQSGQGQPGQGHQPGQQHQGQNRDTGGGQHGSGNSGQNQRDRQTGGSDADRMSRDADRKGGKEGSKDTAK